MIRYGRQGGEWNGSDEGGDWRIQEERAVRKTLLWRWTHQKGGAAANLASVLGMEVEEGLNKVEGGGRGGSVVTVCYRYP